MRRPNVADNSGCLRNSSAGFEAQLYEVDKEFDEEPEECPIMPNTQNQDE